MLQITRLCLAREKDTWLQQEPPRGSKTDHHFIRFIDTAKLSLRGLRFSPSPYHKLRFQSAGNEGSAVQKVLKGTREGERLGGRGEALRGHKRRHHRGVWAAGQSERSIASVRVILAASLRRHLARCVLLPSLCRAGGAASPRSLYYSFFFLQQRPCTLPLFMETNNGRSLRDNLYMRRTGGTHNRKKDEDGQTA